MFKAGLLFLLILIAPLWANAQVQVMFEKFQRLNDPNVTTRSEDRLTVDIENEGEFWLLDSSEAKFDASFRLYLDDQELNYSLSEAFVTTGDGTNTYTVGRKVLNWNPTEVFWGLNHLNARRSFTLLDLEREGIIGCYWDRKMGDVEVNGVLSYGYTRQVKRRIKVRNGGSNSKSEWVRRQPGRIIINEE